MEVVWSDTALDTLSEILVYIDSYFGERVAQRVRESVFSYTRMLEVSPLLGRTFMHLHSGNEVRCLLYKSNQIYYRLLDTHIEILLVWDGRRDPNKLRALLDSLQS